jgi:hypothetical protein
MRRLVILASVLMLAAPAMPAGAAGFDEFQIFDGRIGEPGAVDLNLHLDAGRRGRLGDGAPRNGLLFSPEIGLPTTPWHEVAVFLPVAREFSGDTFGGRLQDPQYLHHPWRCRAALCLWDGCRAALPISPLLRN